MAILAALLVVPVLSIQPAEAATTSPSASTSCPPGMVARPPVLNSALGPCVVGGIAWVATLEGPVHPPGSCPDGWLPRPPGMNPELPGDCFPGQYTWSGPPSIGTGTCPSGWVPTPAGLSAAFGRCVPGELRWTVTLSVPGYRSGTCPSGWVPTPLEWSSALDPCIPGKIVTVLKPELGSSRW
ncbi:MAG TPA: hypothetical protein VM942_07615 [Acidimicrobiales bacterium]|nr:hypothetical protein [Acidimicrobiales bacterium]